MKKELDSELISFAEAFADTYKTHTGGDYYSENKLYHIRYLDGEHGSPNGMPNGTKTFARVEEKSGRIELDKTALMQQGITPNFVFYIVLWCAIRRYTKTEGEADLISLWHYMQTKRRVKDVVIGWAFQFSKSPTEMNKNRMVAIEECINVHSK